MENEPVIKPKFEALSPNLELGKKNTVETSPDKQEVFNDEKISEKVDLSKIIPIKAKKAVTDPVIDEYHKKRELEIDNILAEDLSETFLAMTPDQQKIFKEEGEKTAKKINILLDSTKINLAKIVKLIQKWLKLIPGLNRYFLDQEAKIKGDRIVKIKNKV